MFSDILTPVFGDQIEASKQQAIEKFKNGNFVSKFFKNGKNTLVLNGTNFHFFRAAKKYKGKPYDFFQFSAR